MKAAIERGRLRAPCTACDREIARDELRLAEPCNDGRIPNARLRYFHLECGIRVNPRLVRETLIASETEVEDRVALLQRLQDLLVVDDGPAPAPAARAPKLRDPTIDELLDELERDPTDRGVLTVLGDALALRNDPRGELIAIELALERPGADHATLIPRRDQLRTSLSPRLAQLPSTRTTWGIGYIATMELVAEGVHALNRLSGAWAHPSLRVLAELDVRDAIRELSRNAPRSVRYLHLRNIGGQLARTIEATIDAFPHLERLHLELTRTFALAHPTLRQLELGVGAEVELEPAALPALTEIRLERDPDLPALSADEARGHLRTLAERGWLMRITHLGLRHSHIDHDFIAALREALAGRRLPRIDHAGAIVEDVASLRALCDELI